MIRYIEGRKPNSNTSLESRLPRQKMTEVTDYQVVPVSEALTRLLTEAKGKSIQCRQWHTMESTFMEARYSILKASGSELRFLDSRNINNRMSIYVRDIAKAEIGEDVEVGFVTFHFDLKDKTHITVIPMT
jgi:hypothetical protein